MVELNPSEVTRYYRLAPKGIKRKVSVFLQENLGAEDKAYSNAVKLGLTLPVERLTRNLFAGLALLYNEQNTKLDGNQVVLDIFNKLMLINEPNAYIRICAYYNRRLVVSFVDDKTKSTDNNPKIFTDLNELDHVLTDLPTYVTPYYKTVYLKEDGEYTFI